jgi:hypothetical protein
METKEELLHELLEDYLRLKLKYEESNLMLLKKTSSLMLETSFSKINEDRAKQDLDPIKNKESREAYFDFITIEEQETIMENKYNYEAAKERYELVKMLYKTSHGVD